jgi:Spy/CpxP family protein refolding chaperone
MKRRSLLTGAGSAVRFALVLGSIGFAVAACAQNPPPPRGPGGPGGPGGRPGGPFGGPMGFRPSALDAPIPALTAGLKLTEDQKTKIAAIQDKFHSDRRDMFSGFGPPPGGPPPGDAGGGPPPGPPDFSKMQAMFQKMQTLQTQNDDKIKALLTTTQKEGLPALLKLIQTLRETQIPAEVLGDLKLTVEQKTKLESIATKGREAMQKMFQGGPPQGGFEEIRETMQKNRSETRRLAMAVLTGPQQEIVLDYREKHPEREGGFGGFGFGPGGPGGPPPGPGGPPPAQ